MKPDSSLTFYDFEETLFKSDAASLLGVFKLCKAARFELKTGDFEAYSFNYDVWFLSLAISSFLLLDSSNTFWFFLSSLNFFICIFNLSSSFLRAFDEFWPSEINFWTSWIIRLSISNSVFEITLYLILNLLMRITESFKLFCSRILSLNEDC